MPPSKSPGPKLDRLITVKLTQRQYALTLAVLDSDRGESISDFTRLAIAELTAKRHRTALTAQSDARTGATSGRAPLELHDTPDSKERK